MTKHQTSALLKMATALQRAVRLEEVAAEFFRTLSASFPQSIAAIKLEGLWGQRKMFLSHRER